LSKSEERVRIGLDAAGLFGALDAARESKGLQWKQVAEQTGVSASTLTRMAQGKRPDIDGFAALTAWLGHDPREFFLGIAAEGNPDPVSTFVMALYKANPGLSPEELQALRTLATSAYRLAVGRPSGSSDGS